MEIDPRRNHYTVKIRRDTKMMMTFIKFQNRVSHPRVTFNLFATGVLLAAVPVIVKGLALPGVIVSYGVGGLLILTALFRQYLTLSMMKSNPEVKENEEITYYFGNTGLCMTTARKRIWAITRTSTGCGKMRKPSTWG